MRYDLVQSKVQSASATLEGANRDLDGRREHLLSCDEATLVIMQMLSITGTLVLTALSTVCGSASHETFHARFHVPKIFVFQSRAIFQGSHRHVEFSKRVTTLNMRLER